MFSSRAGRLHGVVHRDDTPTSQQSCTANARNCDLIKHVFLDPIKRNPSRGGPNEQADNGNHDAGVAGAGRAVSTAM
jgi:hypothetical protein